MNQAEWMDRYLKKVSESSEEGAEAARFAREKNIRVGMKRARRSVGAFWTLGKSLYLNKVHYTMESALEEPRATTLFVLVGASYCAPCKEFWRDLQQKPIWPIIDRN
ncbi:MAG: hypothetical protein DCC59_04755, partial [Chloroflexi bacterium]